MTASSEVSVTLSGKLLSQLRVDAAELEVPVTWLVVGLVCDAAERLTQMRRAVRAGFSTFEPASHAT
jgi:hypothetical protein